MDGLKIEVSVASTLTEAATELISLGITLGKLEGFESFHLALSP